MCYNKFNNKEKFEQQALYNVLPRPYPADPAPRRAGQGQHELEQPPADCEEHGAGPPHLQHVQEKYPHLLK